MVKRPIQNLNPGNLAAEPAVLTNEINFLFLYHIALYSTFLL